VFDEAAASDIASAVFVAAVSGIKSYSYRGRPVLAWFYRIAHNLVGDYRRKTLREKRQASDRAVEDLHSGNGARPHGDPDGLIEDLDLRAALQTLPGRQRDVLILRFFVGLSTPEIARVIGKQPAAVYSLQARAVASLRNALT
jgi:RNA polymerase sigma factor (sigma-70 family)